MDAPKMLAMMEGIIGATIPRKQKIVSAKKMKHEVAVGQLNKKCKGCGHKNKKCTCNKGDIIGS